MVNPDPRSTWQRGYSLLLVVPFIGLALVLTDPPRPLQIIGVVLILLLVATSSALLRRRAGGWRPSETLSRPGDDAD